MKGAATALLFILPSIASAAEGSGQEFSFLASLLQMIAALALVVGLILVTWHFSGKLMRELPVRHQLLAKHIRLVETRYLGQRKPLSWLRWVGIPAVAASSDSGLTLIKQINMLEEIEIIEEKPDQSSFAALLTRLRQTS